MKFEHLVLALCAATLFASCEVKSDTEWPRVSTENKPFTCWWWFGNAVDKENLTWNLEQYARAGIGGVEITPIYGVRGLDEREIQYLSPEWIELYAFALNEGKRLGMLTDLNNGTGWPFGGPHIALDDAATKFIMQTYTVAGYGRLRGKVTVDDPKQTDGVSLDCLMAYGPQGETIDLTDRVAEDGSLDWTAPAGQWTLYALFNGKTYQKVKRMAPGGEGYVIDHFSKPAVEHYLSRIDEAFTKTDAPMPRMFFNDSYEVHRADWTPQFLPEFQRRRGYALQNYFPEFYANDTTELSRRVVSDYRLTIHELLMENFIDTWTDWVHRKGSLVRNQSHGSPGNLIDIYASVDVPECETFGRTRFNIPLLQVDSGMRLNDSNPAVLKFASSAAHISGKTLTSAETFTWLTEHFRTALSQCKPEIDQMFASGVNHVFFHGTPFSPRDEEWPGWLFYASVNMSPSNTIWRDAPAFFEYITRCQSFLQSGRPDNDFLLYAPFYDFWNDYRRTQFMPFSIHGLVDMLPEFNRTVSEIMDLGYDVDYISDKFIESLQCLNGQLVTSGGTHYRALILPNVRYMPHETVAKLNDLAEAGATIIFAGQYPESVPGLTNLESRQRSLEMQLSRLPNTDFGQGMVSPAGAGRVITGRNYAELLAATNTRGEAFRHTEGGQFTRRVWKDGHLYFLAMLQDRTIDGWVPLSVNAASAMIYDPVTGKKGAAHIRNRNGNSEVYLQMKPGESLIVKTFDNSVIREKHWEYLEPEGTPFSIDRGWRISFVQSEPAINDEFVTDTLTSWTALDDPNATVNMGTALYKTTFTLPAERADEWLLDLGKIHESARVRINGRDAGTVYAIPYTLRVGPLVQQGENTIEIEVTNLPANRIADYDRRDVQWRKFKDINLVDIFYQPTKYDHWEVVPSGLTGPVTLTPTKHYFP